jgi:hypothetical protein
MNSVRCCQQEPASPDWADELRCGEVNLQDEHYNGSGTGYADPHGTLTKSVASMVSAKSFACCRELPFEDTGTVPLQPLESLSYTPFRFDVGHTVDVERSHQRYSDILLHSNRAMTQKRSKAWGNWINAATAGRTATLLTGIADGDQQSTRPLIPVPAKYYLDRSGTRLCIRPDGPDAVMTEALSITLDNIHLICPVTDAASCSSHLDVSKLSAAQQRCAVLLQYSEEDGKVDRRRACLIVDSEAARDDFVQALMALWLERRNDHSMWF